MYANRTGYTMSALDTVPPPTLPLCVFMYVCVCVGGGGAHMIYEISA